MGDILATFFAEIIINFLFSFPGAVIRWIFSNHKKSIKEIWKDDMFTNATIGIVFFLSVIGLFVYLS